MKPQASFLDDDVGPNLCQQFLLADNFVGMGQQNDEDIECPRAQLDRCTVVGQKPLAGDETEGTKDMTSLVRAAAAIMASPLEAIRSRPSSISILGEEPAPGIAPRSGTARDRGQRQAGRDR